jgi:hypothetical protein
MNKEQLHITITALMENHSNSEILDAIAEWHLNFAKHAPKAQALKLRWNAAQLQCVANDLWPTPLPDSYDETEPSFN